MGEVGSGRESKHCFGMKHESGHIAHFAQCDVKQSNEIACLSGCTGPYALRRPSPFKAGIGRAITRSHAARRGIPAAATYDLEQRFARHTVRLSDVSGNHRN